LDGGPQQSWLRRATVAVQVVEDGLLVVLLSGLILFSSAQIVLRNFFSVGITWGDGLTRLAVLWLALLGALAASREGRHITMGAVVRWLPKRWQLGAAVTADAFAVAVSGLLAWSSFEFVRDSRAYGDVLLDGVPAWWLQSIMPVAFALIAVRYLIRGLRRLGDR
jgi:TRAP-type C4-dicarboxylate transport system permease small subunit